MDIRCNQRSQPLPSASNLQLTGRKSFDCLFKEKFSFMNLMLDAYQQYQAHKKPSCQSKQPTKIIEVKSPNEKETVCAEDDFWGAHLNKSASSDNGEEKITKREKQKETALERISKKMRKNIIDSQVRYPCRDLSRKKWVVCI